MTPWGRGWSIRTEIIEYDKHITTQGKQAVLDLIQGLPELFQSFPEFFQSCPITIWPERRHSKSTSLWWRLHLATTPSHSPFTSTSDSHKSWQSQQIFITDSILIFWKQRMAYIIEVSTWILYSHRCQSLCIGLHWTNHQKWPTSVLSGINFPIRFAWISYHI